MEQTSPAVVGRLETPVRQHTPGPWHATTADEWRTASGEHAQWGRFDISAGSLDPEADNYYRIASVSNVNNSEQNQANAKLIAAAPDLLEALQAITNDRGTWNCMPMHLRDLAGAALAKAVGSAA